MAISIAGNQSGNDRYLGTGTPEGVVPASIGTTYIQTDGTPGNIKWLKESGTGSTGWRNMSPSGENPALDRITTTGVYRTNMPRMQAVSNMSALTTQVALSTAIYLYAGDVITHATFLSGGTAANVPTNWWFALYDTQATPALLGQTTDVLTAAWGANSAATLDFTPITIATSGVHYATVMVKATTPPTLAGVTLENAAAAGSLMSNQKILARTHGSSLTTTAPSTLTSASTVATVPLVILT